MDNSGSLCIVPCGSKKIWSKYATACATMARDAYIGSFSKKCIEYAEMFHAGHYRILSAKYGFMPPDFFIPEDYNITFNKPSDSVISTDRLKQQALADGLIAQYGDIIVLGGREYVSRINAIFSGRVIHTPLSSCKGIGYMMQRLLGAIQSSTPLETAQV